MSIRKHPRYDQPLRCSTTCTPNGVVAGEMRFYAKRLLPRNAFRLQCHISRVTYIRFLRILDNFENILVFT